MSRTSQPTRLASDVYESAVIAAALSSRTVAQQLSHWARLGRELELAPGVDLRGIRAVLDGAASYDELDERAKVVVTERWAERIAGLRDGLDYAAAFTEAAEPYSELDDDGAVVVRHPPA